MIDQNTLLKKELGLRWSSPFRRGLGLRRKHLSSSRDISFQREKRLRDRDKRIGFSRLASRTLPLDNLRRTNYLTPLLPSLSFSFGLRRLIFVDTSFLQNLSAPYSRMIFGSKSFSGIFLLFGPTSWDAPYSEWRQKDILIIV